MEKVHADVRYHLSYTFSAVLEMLLPLKPNLFPKFRKMYRRLTESREPRTRLCLACSLWKISKLFLEHLDRVKGADSEPVGGGGTGTGGGAPDAAAEKQQRGSSGRSGDNSDDDDSQHDLPSARSAIRAELLETFTQFTQDRDEIKTGLAKNIGNFDPDPKYLQSLSKMIASTDNWRLRHFIATTSLPQLCRESSE